MKLLRQHSYFMMMFAFTQTISAAIEKFTIDDQDTNNSLTIILSDEPYIPAAKPNTQREESCFVTVSFHNSSKKKKKNTSLLSNHLISKTAETNFGCNLTRTLATTLLKKAFSAYRGSAPIDSAALWISRIKEQSNLIID